MSRGLTEADLRQDFDKYNQFVQEISARYKVAPLFADSPEDTSAPQYTAEATFSYQVHTSV